MGGKGSTWELVNKYRRCYVTVQRFQSSAASLQAGADDPCLSASSVKPLNGKGLSQHCYSNDSKYKVISCPDLKIVLPIEANKAWSSGSGLDICKSSSSGKGTKKKELVGDTKAGGLRCLIVQVSGLNSELKNENLACDVFSHEGWYLAYSAAKADLQWWWRPCSAPLGASCAPGSVRRSVRQGPCPCGAPHTCSNETSKYRDLVLCHWCFGIHSKQSLIYFISCHITRNFLSFVKRLSLIILSEKAKSPSRREAQNAINMVNHLQVFPVLHGFLGPQLYQ